jgi:hypothetical protein
MELIATIRTDSGDSVGSVIAPAKVFGSGSDGYFGQRKLTWNGAKYQAQVQLVRIGSKDEAEAAEAEAPEG